MTFQGLATRNENYKTFKYFSGSMATALHHYWYNRKETQQFLNLRLSNIQFSDMEKSVLGMETILKYTTALQYCN